MIRLLLYHTKNNQGTTTACDMYNAFFSLYHTKNNQGTTTLWVSDNTLGKLYHTKNNQGTTRSPYFTLLLYHTINHKKRIIIKNVQNNNLYQPAVSCSLKYRTSHFYFNLYIPIQKSAACCSRRNNKRRLRSLFCLWYMVKSW